MQAVYSVLAVTAYTCRLFIIVCFSRVVSGPTTKKKRKRDRPLCERVLIRRRWVEQITVFFLYIYIYINTTAKGDGNCRGDGDDDLCKTVRAFSRRITRRQTSRSLRVDKLVYHFFFFEQSIFPRQSIFHIHIHSFRSIGTNYQHVGFVWNYTPVFRKHRVLGFARIWLTGVRTSALRPRPISPFYTFWPIRHESCCKNKIDRLRLSIG